MTQICVTMILCSVLNGLIRLNYWRVRNPEREEDRLIVYRWYGRHKQRWWYGVTTISQQDIWADYCKDAVRIAKERARKRKEKRADNDMFTHFLPKPVR